MIPRIDCISKVDLFRVYFVFRCSFSQQIALPLGFCSSCSRCANVCNTKTAIIRQEGHHPEEEDHHARAEVAMQQRPVNVDEKLGVNPQQPARSSVVAEG